MLTFARFMCVCLIALFLGLTIATPIANQYLVVNGPEWLTQGKVTTSYDEVLKEVPAHYPPGSTTLKWVTEEVKTKTRDSAYVDVSCHLFGWTTALTAFFFVWLLLVSFELEKAKS